MKHFEKLILLILIGNSLFIYSQKKITTQSLFWNRYYLKLRINEQWALGQEIEERAYWFPWRQHQFLLRTHLEKNLGNNWNTALGFTYFIQTLPHNPTIKNTENNTELRPQIEFGYKQNITNKLSLHHRYWSEFRFIEQSNHQIEYQNNRSRYKIEFRYKPTNKLTLKAFEEIFLNFGHNIVHNSFDQNRYGLSFQYMPYKNFGFEIGYLNWFQERSSGVDYFNRHIIRCTVHHNINLKKIKKWKR